MLVLMSLQLQFYSFPMLSGLIRTKNRSKFVKYIQVNDVLRRIGLPFFKFHLSPTYLLLLPLFSLASEQLEYFF